jgi:hypothetical protein
MTSAGGGERLNDKSPPPSPIGEKFKNSIQSSPPPTQHSCEYENGQLKMCFSWKVLNRFFILKNAQNQHDISFRFYLRRFSLNCRFLVENNAQSQITLIKCDFCVQFDFVR